MDASDWIAIAVGIIAVVSVGLNIVQAVSASRARKRDEARADRSEIAEIRAEQESWLEAFSDYRRLHLTPLAETLRVIYPSFKAAEKAAPDTWEQVVAQARYPNHLPSTEEGRFTLWEARYVNTLDMQDQLLLRLAKYVYPSSVTTPPPPMRERSPLTQEQYEAVDAGRHGVANYFDHCGYLRQYSHVFERFLEERVRAGHYPHLK